LSMLAAKLGMGVTEALVSVWATVWVQRNAPSHARAQWLTLAGVSAGIGNGTGSGFASLWDPVAAFFFQASVLLAIWVLLCSCSASMFRFGGAVDDDESPSNETHMIPSISSMPDPARMLAEQVGREMVQPAFATLVNIESMKYPGYFLDATADPVDDGWKVRITRGDPTKGDRSWAMFKMRQVHGLQGNTYTFESERLPGHYLSAYTETGCWQGGSRMRGMRVLVSEGDASQTASEFRLRPLSSNAGAFGSWISPRDNNEQIVLFESVALKGHYLDATSEKDKLVGAGDRLKVRVTRGKLENGNWAHFKIHEVESDQFVREVSTSVADGLLERLLYVIVHKPLWLWTALSISLCCFITSGVSFLWQITVASLWNFDNAWSFGFFLFSTGLGGFAGVAVGPQFFDRRLGGFSSPAGKAVCLHWCKRMMFIAALCGTVCALLLGEKACRLVEANAPQVIYWHLVVLVIFVFVIFALLNSITGTLYGINTEAVGDDMRTFAAGLTVSFQNVFGYAFGPLLPSCVAGFVGHIIEDVWPDIPWDKKAVDGARFAVGMASALAATWLLFAFTRAAVISARVLQIKGRAQDTSGLPQDSSQL